MAQFFSFIFCFLFSVFLILGLLILKEYFKYFKRKLTIFLNKKLKKYKK